jgi:hypothetical protein
MKKESKHSNCFQLKGVWLYKLPDPFRYIHYMPLDSNEISIALGVSKRTAQRICCGEKELSKSELLNLQFIHFGYIPDPIMARLGFHVKKGVIYCYKSPGFSLEAGQIVAYSLLSTHYISAAAELERVKQRLRDLENPKPPEPTNIIQFSDYFKSKG